MTSNIAKASARPAFLSASFQAGLATASHWRMLLLWVLLSLLPAALLALPFWLLLGASFDFSVHAATLAREIDMVALADVYEKASRGGAA